MDALAKAESQAAAAHRRPGFDNEKYLTEQSRAILERVERFGDKLYLEFGGKLLFDYHAARVLPGYDPNVKMRLLRRLKDQAEIILCIHAGAIERRKVRADFGITYDSDAMKMIDDIRQWGLEPSAVVVTRYDAQPAARTFRRILQRRGVRVITHAPIHGYPSDVERIVSDEGYGANSFIETSKPLVVVTGPGPGSGKLATCLSQLYHEARHGCRAGYAKFETFPIWDLPLNHPANIAYEAATADLRDVNVIDPFHLDAYDKRAVNYNRDVESFPVLKAILERITGAESPYRSPTDMGVNRVGSAIMDDEAVRHAARQEVIRRAFRYRCEYLMGVGDEGTVERVEGLMKTLNVTQDDRNVVAPARTAAEEAREHNKGNEGVFCGAAVELSDGTVVTGCNSPLMHAASALVLNAAKHLAKLPPHLHLIAPNVIEAVGELKQDILNGKGLSLDLEETLIALGISSTTNPTARLAMEQLKALRGCEAHMTHIPTPGDETGLRRLGLNLTTDPQFASRHLFMS
ncbi:MAG: DUF1846 domain-containing protein [Phycisphaerae bacterium]